MSPPSVNAQDFPIKCKRTSFCLRVHSGATACGDEEVCGVARFVMTHLTHLVRTATAVAPYHNRFSGDETTTRCFFPLRDPLSPHLCRPEDLSMDIVTLGFVKNLTISGDEGSKGGAVVSFSVELTTPACPVKEVGGFTPVVSSRLWDGWSGGGGARVYCHRGC